MALDVYNARFQINAGVVGTDAIDKFNTKLNTVGKTADSVNRQIASLSSGVRMLAGAFGATQIMNLAVEFARTTIQLDAFQKQLGVGFGSAGKAELITLRDTMRDLGISQEEALGSAVRFTSALKLSGQSMAEANRNFEAASKLILSNKLTAQGAQRVFYAMAQIASKGKLMSEELNGQLGDTLAGFTQQVAAAMGKTTGELLKNMQDGKVSAEEFFIALQKIGDGIDANSLDSAARSLGNLKNAFFDFQSQAFEAGTIKAGLDAATGAVRFLTENYKILNLVVLEASLVLFGRYGSALVASTTAKFAAVAASRAQATAEFQAAEAQAASALVTQRATALKLAHAEASLVTAGAVSAAGVAVVEANNAMLAAEARLAAARAAMLATGAGAGALRTAMMSLVNFVGGPVGVAFFAVGAAVYYFTTRLNENEQAIKAAEGAGDSFARSQSFFTRMIDSSTGSMEKLTEQTWKAYEIQVKLSAAQAKTKSEAASAAAAAAIREDDRNRTAAREMPSRFGPIMVRGAVRPEAEAAAQAIESGDFKKFETFLPSAKKQTEVVRLREATFGAALLAKNQSDAAQAELRWLDNAKRGLPQSPQDRALLESVGSLALTETKTPARPTAAATPKTKGPSPYESAMNTFGGNIAQAEAELAAMDQYGAKVKNANQALAEHETAKGKYAKWTVQQKEAYVAQGVALDALEQKISGLTAANSMFMDMGKQRAQAQFQLDHWDTFGTNLNRAREAQVEFNISQGVYLGASDAVIAKLRKEAIETDKVAKAVKDRQKAEGEQKETQKAFARMSADNDNLRDQWLALSLTNFEYDRMVARRNALADIDEKVVGWEDQKAAAYRKGAMALLAQREELERLNNERERSFMGGSQQAIRNYAEEIGNMGQDAMNLWTDAIKSTEDALVQFTMTGKLSFKDMANSIIADLIRIAIRQSVVSAITKGLGMIFGGGPGLGSITGASAAAAVLPGLAGTVVKVPGAANGMAFDMGGVRKFAQGGIVSSPTMFRYGDGMGLMGEAGPEAIMPLRRGANGRLGVEASGGGGGGTQNVVVNVNVEGGTQQSQGDPGKAAELGKLVASAVRAELVQQKRPGGLLAA